MSFYRKTCKNRIVENARLYIERPAKTVDNSCLSIERHAFSFVFACLSIERHANTVENACLSIERPAFQMSSYRETCKDIIICIAFAGKPCKIEVKEGK